jgi:O-antigen/teichoic acid export membrane protein
LKITKKIQQSDFVKNVLTLATGNVLGQVIGLSLTLVLTRIYTPEDFGSFGLMMAISSGIAIIISMRYELAIMRPKDDSDAFKVLILALFVCVLITLISAIIITLLVLLNSNIPKWSLLIPLMAFSIGIFQIFNNWANRQKKYKKIAASRIIASSVNSTTSIGFGLLNIGGFGLFLGNLIGQIISSLNLINIRILVKNIKITKVSELKFWAKRYKDMPQTNLFQAIIDLYLTNGLVYLIPIYFSNSILGFYSFSMRILQAPVSFVGSAIAQVFYQKATDTFHANKDLNQIVKQTILKSSLIALPLPVILVLFGPDVFAFIFSKNWRIAGEYSQILAPWIYFDFIRMTVSQLPIILTKQKHLLFTSLLGSIALTGSFLVAGVIFNNIVWGLCFTSFFLSLLAIYNTFWIYKISKKQNIT